MECLAAAAAEAGKQDPTVRQPDCPTVRLPNLTLVCLFSRIDYNRMSDRDYSQGQGQGQGRRQDMRMCQDQDRRYGGSPYDSPEPM